MFCDLQLIGNKVVEGHLAGSVDRTCDSSSQGYDFKTHVEPRAY